MSQRLDPASPSAWLAALGVSDAPVPRAGVATSLRFFALRMPTLPQEKQFSFLKAMDLHAPVREVTIAPPTILAAFRYAREDPLRLFYTKAGSSPRMLGIDPNDRYFRRFKVIWPCAVLESRTCSVRDWEDKKSGAVFEGGGAQFIVPDATRTLQIVP